MQDTTTQFTQYLHVVNQALHENRGRFPYRELIHAGNRALADKEIGVAVYKHDASSPFDYFTVTFSGGMFNLLAHGKEHPDIAWKLPEDHMREVVEDPSPFIQTPSKLDLDWFKKRVGLD